MHPIGLLDLIATGGFVYAAIAALRSKTPLLDGVGRTLLVASFLLYVVVSFNNALSHGLDVGAVEQLEDYLEVLFAPLLLFAVYTVRARSELVRRERAELERKAGELRLAVTLESTTDAVVSTDPTGRILFANHAALILLGADAPELVGRPITDAVPLRSDDGDEASPHPVARALASGESVPIYEGSIVTMRDGSERIVEGSASPLATGDRTPSGAVLTLRDVTDKVAVRREMLRVQNLDSLGVLAGGIAHDFNNILTAMLGNLSLARLRIEAPDVTLPLLAGAEKAALRAKDLTQQLLTFAKGRLPQRRRQSLVSMIEETTAFVVQGSSVRCELELPGDLWWVDADGGQLSQVVSNLVLNARQAMHDGGVVRVSVHNRNLTGGEVATLPAGRYLELVVADEGPGIAAEHLERIFDPYFTTKKDGSGLGLATVHSIVRNHGGHIVPVSKLGEGCTMHVFLPAVLGLDGVRKPEEVEAPIAGGRALVMDDEESVRLVAQRLLEYLGFEVETTQDGAEAIEHYRSALDADRPFDLVILDLTVPGGMGGLETLRNLRELDAEVVAVVSSGYANDAILANHAHYGFDGVVPKPFRLEELRQALAGVGRPHGRQKRRAYS